MYIDTKGLSFQNRERCRIYKYIHLINSKTYLCIGRCQNKVILWKNICSSTLNKFVSQHLEWKTNFLEHNKKIPTFGFLTKVGFSDSTRRQSKRALCHGFFQFKRLYFLTHLLFLVFCFFLLHPVFNWVGHHLKIAPEKQNIPPFNITQFSLIRFQVKPDHLASLLFLIQVFFYNLWHKACIWHGFSQFLQELLHLPSWYLLSTCYTWNFGYPFCKET